MNCVEALLDVFVVFFFYSVSSSPLGTAFCFLFQKVAEATQKTSKWLLPEICARSWVCMGELSSVLGYKGGMQLLRICTLH